MGKGKFRKDFTPEQYAQYLENQAKTEKYEHDGLESWEIKEGVKEGYEESSELRKRNECTCPFNSFGTYDAKRILFSLSNL